jgi:integrase
LDAIFEDYLCVARTDLSPATISAYTSAFRAFQAYLDTTNIDLTAITQPQVQGFINSRGDLKPSTLKTHIKSVRAAFNYGRNCSLTIQRTDDPFSRLRYPSVPDAEPVTFSNEELKRLFTSIETDREWICFHLFAYAGLRRAEACEIRWEDVDFQNRSLLIKGKGNKVRRIPLHPRLAEALAPHRGEGWVLPTLQWAGWTVNGEVKQAGTKLDPDSLHRSNDFWFRRAGVHKGNHAFRRTMNSVMKEKGVPTEDRERIMGWAPRDVQGRHYTRFLDETLQTAIRKIDYGLYAEKKQRKERHLRVVA